MVCIIVSDQINLKFALQASLVSRSALSGGIDMAWNFALNSPKTFFLDHPFGGGFGLPMQRSMVEDVSTDYKRRTCKAVMHYVHVTFEKSRCT